VCACCSGFVACARITSSAYHVSRTRLACCTHTHATRAQYAGDAALMQRIEEIAQRVPAEANGARRPHSMRTQAFDIELFEQVRYCVASRTGGESVCACRQSCRLAMCRTYATNSQTREQRSESLNCPFC
jgi:hypothetical protein